MVVVVRCPERSVERGSVLAAQRKSSAFLGGKALVAGAEYCVLMVSTLPFTLKAMMLARNPKDER